MGRRCTPRAKPILDAHRRESRVSVIGSFGIRVMPWNTMASINVLLVGSRNGSGLVGLVIRKSGMSYEEAVSPVLAVVFTIIALMTLVYWFVPLRFREVIIGVVVVGMMIELVVILPVWFVYI
jgi:hypothetical protein